MPLYEFVCEKHGKFERVRNLSHKELPPCPVRGCKHEVTSVEYSVPARRPPEAGIQS